METTTDMSTEARLQADTMLTDYFDVFEQYLLSCLIQCPDFSRLYHRRLRTHNAQALRDRTRRVEGFTCALKSRIQKYFTYYNDLPENPEAQNSGPWKFILTLLNYERDERRITADELTEAQRIWDEAVAQTQNVRGIVEAGIPQYLEIRTNSINYER